MFRLLLLILVVFFVGWVAWPAYSAYEIYGGVKTSDEAVLKEKVDWHSLRESLRPAIAAQVDRMMEKSSDSGIVMSPELKEQLKPQAVDMALKAIVTPKGIAMLMAHGGDVSQVVEETASKTLTGLKALTGGNDNGGGLGGLIDSLGKGNDSGGLGDLIGKLTGKKSSRDNTSTGGDNPTPAYGFDNLKRFAYTGIGSMEVGVAKNPAASAPDVTAIMAFQDFDWKLVGLKPRVE